jgi:5'-nucleotidase
MKKRIVCIGWCLSVCSLSAQPIKTALVHINDVYEIAALDGGRSGGLARVATLKKRLQKRADAVFLCLAGDFLSPSALGRALMDGRAVAGAQMIAALNAAGLDFAAFGNHEFDLEPQELQARLDESKFTWLSANLYRRTEHGFQPFVQNGRPVDSFAVLRVRKKNAVFRLGLTGVTLNFAMPPYAKYTDAGAALDKVAAMLKDSTDALVAMTHLNFREDWNLASSRPEWALFMGGHEHENLYRRTPKGTVVAKADANARSAYVHLFTFRPRTRRVRLRSRLIALDDKIRPDPQTQRVVDDWMNRGKAAYRAMGFEPDAFVAQLTQELDGTEAAVRNTSNPLTRLMAEAFWAAGDSVEFAFFNAGSIRLDDKLRGTLTQYDLFRLLPFGGKLVQAQVDGQTLLEIKAAGEANRGTGGFLHWHGDTAAIEPSRFYRVVFNEFLLSGRERNMSFFTPARLREIRDSFPENDPRSDVRRALCRYFLTRVNPETN